MDELKRYICVKGFALDYCDSDGFSTEETMAVEAGEIFELRNRYPYNIVGGSDCVHLENADGTWIEISTKTLAEHFEEADND